MTKLADLSFWDEPDCLFSCAYGLPFHILRGPMKHFCGYVGVPQTHPWFGRDYDERVKVSPEFFNSPVEIDDVGVITLLCADIDVENNLSPISLILRVHGGITYARIGSDGYWYFGFDCAHSGDICPSILIYRDYPNDYRVYRDFSYVKRQCYRLAEQLSEIN